MARSISVAGAVLLAVVLSAATGAQSPEPWASPPAEPGETEPLRMQDARQSFTANALTDGSVLIVGGFDGTNLLDTAEVFDPATRRFRTVGALGEPRHGHRATLMPSGRVLVSGGSDGMTNATASVEVYDPGAETFSMLGRLKRPRIGHTASLLDDGTVLVAGGFANDDTGRAQSSAEVFDPATGLSTPVGRMNMGRAMHSATRMDDGRIAIIGGIGERKSARTMEVYDPRRQRFTAPAKLGASANFHQTTRLDDGRLFVAGINGAAILVTPDASRGRRLSDWPRVSGQSTATLLDDGRVVVIGGGQGDEARVSIFDPSDDSGVPAGRMRQARQVHQAVRLPDGTVLVMGGAHCGEVLDSAEIWDPQVMSPITGGRPAKCQLGGPATPAPLPPLGAASVGGRIEMPGSAFSITVPDPWVVEMADPDTDVFAAAAGAAWEALRAASPDGTRACSVAVGVAEVSLRDQSGTGSNGAVSPSWHPTRKSLLMVPSPRVEERDGGSSSMTSFERLHRDHEGLEHDVLYSLVCVNVPELRFDQIMSSFELLPPVK